MFGRKTFGRKVDPEQRAEPKRPAVRPRGQVFSAELFEGTAGDFLREAGYFPEDPGNHAANLEPLAVLLAEDQAALRRSTEALNRAADFPLAPWYLLPVELWRGSFGPWLRQELDLSPYRPWNTIFLPGNAAGAKALGLPVIPAAPTRAEDVLMSVAVAAELYRGVRTPECEAMELLLSQIRQNFPGLFPADIGDYSDKVRNARANVRTVAFLHSATHPVVGKDVIIRSQSTFLGLPEEQLVA